MRAVGSLEWLACAGILAAITTGPAMAQMRAPAGGEVHALIVGIDHYPHLRELKGALADAQDLDLSLRRAGVIDINHIPEQGARRPAVVTAMNRMLDRSKANDLVIISFAGHGMQLPERVKGSKPDGLDEAYLLYDFDPSGKSPDLIIGPEMKHWLAQFEAKSVDVVFIADSCFGGGMTRSWDPRSGDVTYRSDPGLTAAIAAAASANLAPLSTAQDAVRDESTFRRVTFLAAVDKNTPSPEVDIPGERTKRGALTYAVARAIDRASGGAGGAITRKDLFANLRQVVLQYSNNRQLIVTEPTTGADVLAAPVWRAGPVAGASAAAAASPVALAASAAKPIRVAVVNGAPSLLSNREPIFTPFIVVADRSNADVVWDARAREAIVGGDVIAHDVDASDIPAVVDRTQALNELAKLSEKTAQPIEVLPDNRLHHKGETVTAQAADVRNKYAVIFNIAGDGTVQFLFPQGRERPQIASPTWRLDNPPISVSPPYGSDSVVAITSDERLGDLEAALRRLDGRRVAGQIPQLLATNVPQRTGYRVGIARVFTAP